MVGQPAYDDLKEIPQQAQSAEYVYSEEDALEGQDLVPQMHWLSVCRALSGALLWSGEHGDLKPKHTQAQVDDSESKYRAAPHHSVTNTEFNELVLRALEVVVLIVRLTFCCLHSRQATRLLSGAISPSQRLRCHILAMLAFKTFTSLIIMVEELASGVRECNELILGCNH